MIKGRTTNKQIKPLAFPVYFWVVAGLAFAGLFDSIYLAISHYRVYTDIGYRSFCAISQSINCDTVSQSSYAIFLAVPVPVWGVIGYTFFLLCLPFAWSKAAEKQRVWTFLFFLSLAFSLCSIVLAFISSFYIHSHCVMCIVSYGINFMLVFYIYLIRKRFEVSGLLKALTNDIAFLWQRKSLSVSVLLPYSVAVIVVLIFFPVYWSFEPPEFSAHIPHGMTEDGHPWVGAENPKLEIIEFTDYLCFQCNKMHFFLRQMLANHPGKIKLIHRHFPMDHEVNPMVKKPTHIGSGKLAILTIYAATQGKFWQMSDIIFGIAREQPKIDIKKLAHEVGLDQRELSRSFFNAQIQHKLKKDILDGIKLGVTGTPSFVINGKLYQGQIPPQIIKTVLD
jgi:uncharacterized membrane protein/predicted DsbA family dithiol-disulfide isomerase